MSTRLKATLDEHREMIVYTVMHQLTGPGAQHYSRLTGSELRVRVEELCQAFTGTVATGGDGFIEHILRIAHQRVSEGYALREVLLALRIFEETVWRLVKVHVPLEEQVDCLAEATSIIGAAKDELAEAYLVLLERSEARRLQAAERADFIARGTDSPPVTEEDRGPGRRIGAARILR